MSYNLHLLLSTVYLQQDNSVENVHLQLVCSKQINNNTHPLRGVFLTNNYELYYKSLVHFSVKKLMFVIKKIFWQCVLFIFCILLYCYIFGSCFGFTILLSPVFLRFFPFLWFLPPFSWSSCPHLSICFLLIIEVWVPLQSQLLQVFWRDTNPFPIQLGDIISPAGGIWLQPLLNPQSNKTLWLLL